LVLVPLPVAFSAVSDNGHSVNLRSFRLFCDFGWHCKPKQVCKIGDSGKPPTASDAGEISGHCLSNLVICRRQYGRGDRRGSGGEPEADEDLSDGIGRVDRRKYAHAPAAAITNQNVHREYSSEELSPRVVPGSAFWFLIPMCGVIDRGLLFCPAAGMNGWGFGFGFGSDLRSEGSGGSQQPMIPDREACHRAAATTARWPTEDGRHIARDALAVCGPRQGRRCEKRGHPLFCGCFVGVPILFLFFFAYSSHILRDVMDGRLGAVTMPRLFILTVAVESVCWSLSFGTGCGNSSRVKWAARPRRGGPSRAKTSAGVVFATRPAWQGCGCCQSSRNLLLNRCQASESPCRSASDSMSSGTTLCDSSSARMRA
jgi:hypothetical protein